MPKKRNWVVLGYLSVFICGISFLFSCKRNSPDKSGVEIIASAGEQDSIYHQLAGLVRGQLELKELAGYSVFFVLPIQTICPYCRNKIIDSIVRNKDEFPENRYIIISAKGGRKTINSFFRERDKELPTIANHLFLDTTFEAYSLQLCKDVPMYYYIDKGKVIKRKGSLPSSVKQDLHTFFHQ